MTELEKLKKVFDDLGIKYSEDESSFPIRQIEIFIHYSNITFVFDTAGKYITSDISY